MRGSWWVRTYASHRPQSALLIIRRATPRSSKCLVRTATPVVYGLQNALLESEVNEDAGNMAAIDPAAFAHVAPLIDTDFLGTTAANAMDALQRQPTASC